ncbi:MAG TPA: signal peptidase II [Candidatus Binataceae bacterium]|nr:signal peptidase II [Candidatus Binataceae bacterium]
MDAELTASSAASVQRVRRPFWFLLGFVTIPLIVLDQVSKIYVSGHMLLYDNITLIPNYLDITFTKNPGAAFSMFATMTPSLRIGLLISLISVAVVVLLVMLAQCDRINVTSFAYSLILAGAAGNLIDRALRGFEVIDFIRAHYYDYNWPVFNVADSAITIGVALIVIATLFFREAETKS